MTALAVRQSLEPDLFRDDFAANAASLPGSGLSWLDKRRAEAMAAFTSTGVPTRRVEAWKYTDLAASLSETQLAPASRIREPKREAGAFAHIPGTRLVFVGGFLHAMEGSETGVEIVDLSVIDASTPGWVRDHLGQLAQGREQPLGAASLALFRSGAAVRVRAPNVALHLDFVNPPRRRDAATHSRVLIIVEEAASLRLLESHTGEGTDQTLANIGVEFVLMPGARLEHVRVQAEASSVRHITNIGAQLKRGAEYRALYAALGAHLSRLDVRIRLEGEGARAELRNVAAPRAGIADITTVMDHASKHTTSRQLFKSVVGGNGRAVNQGLVLVREGAVKTDSHQLFKSLLLSPRAECDAKPELEIFADDVICGHGTAIGALDENELFYLRSRGIPEPEAKQLLIRAFLEDAISDFVDPAVHDALWRRLSAVLEAMGQAEP
jgi:Fe-S cluster assembly protein SufD